MVGALIFGLIAAFIFWLVIYGIIYGVYAKNKDDKTRKKIGIITYLAIFIFCFISFIPSENNSSSSSSDNSSTTKSSISNIKNCPKCGNQYNVDTWGKMCGSCWKKGEGLKCEHGYPGKKFCPSCK